MVHRKYSDHKQLELELRYKFNITRGQKDPDKFLMGDVRKEASNMGKIQNLLKADWPNENPAKWITQGVRPRRSNPFLMEPERGHYSSQKYYDFNQAIEAIKDAWKVKDTKEFY